MSKSIKLKNDTYIDSSGIVHNKEKLSDILNTESRILTFNEEYVYSTDLEYYCLKIGKVVFLNIRTIAFKKGFEETGTQFISGLPKPSAYLIFYLHGGAEASGTALRCGITAEGTIVNHYSIALGVGDSANRQYGGTLIYLTNE